MSSKKFLAYYMLIFLIADTVCIGVGYFFLIMSGHNQLGGDFITPLGVVFAAFAISEKSERVKSIVSAFCMLYVSFLFYAVYEALGYKVVLVAKEFVEEPGGLRLVFLNFLMFGFALNLAMAALSMGRVVWLLFRYSVEGTYIERETWLKSHRVQDLEVKKCQKSVDETDV